MAELSAMDIYGELPQTNCGDCNFPTCMAFAMQLANKQASLDQCPHVSEEAKEALSASAAPPMRTVTIGSNGNEIEVGGETVLFRHEEKFHNPTGVAVQVTDRLEDDRLEERIEKINGLQFERIGEQIGINLVALKNSQREPSDFGKAASIVKSNSNLPLILISDNPQALKEALEKCKEGRPLIGFATPDNREKYAEIADNNDCPLAVKAKDLESLAETTSEIADQGLEDLVLVPPANGLRSYVQVLTKLRRLALEEEFRPLGYPVLTFARKENPFQSVADGVSLILKYSSLMITDSADKWQLLPMLTARQHIYIDPQVPNSVEPKLRKVGEPGPDSPVLFTTNFTLTYFSVEGEVENSGKSAYITVMDTDGLGVLNAYADDRLSADKIVETIQEQGAMEKVEHDKLIIPGLLAMLRMSIQEEGGWEVIVGPEDAAGLPRFFRQEW